jgi:anti-sigma regulatory factor (Ser/Thr protein kinase)
MEMSQSILIAVAEPSQVAEARRIVDRTAKEHGLDEDSRGRAAIVVTEAGNNLIRHAGSGQIIFRILRALRGVELIVLDRGPGMSDIRRSLTNGYSTGGGSGTGLGAIQRLSSVFDLFSAPEQGTVLASVILPPGAKASRRFQSSAVAIPIPGETVCGDTWALHFDGPDNLQILLADGLGHGPRAHEAAIAAAVVFNSAQNRSPSDLMHAVHDGLRGTRGAAVAILSITFEAAYCSVGNIAGIMYRDGEIKHLVSYNGTVGSELRKVREEHYGLGEQTVIVLNSDGLLSNWSLDAYPGLWYKHPAVIAGVLVRDFARGMDDLSIVATTLRGRYDRFTAEA